MEEPTAPWSSSASNQTAPAQSERPQPEALAASPGSEAELGSAVRCLVNGEAISEVPVSDRGLAYGDGLFETLAVRAERPCCWLAHLDRLALGAVRLGLPLPSPARLQREAAVLCNGVARGTLKIILTRGPSQRGYRLPPNPQPTRIVTLTEAASAADDRIFARGARVRICHGRLGINPQLAGIKHLNRLEQVMARSEWSDPAIDEGLMLDTEGALVCGTMTNLFMIDHNGLHTPRIDRNGVAGTARARLLAEASRAGLAVHERRLTLGDLIRAPAAVLTNSLMGIWPIRFVEDHELDPSRLPWPLLERVQAQLLRPGADQ